MLDLKSDDKACCDDIYRVAVEKKLQLETKLKALKTMSEALTRLLDICSHDRKSLEGCPILGALLEAGIQNQELAESRRPARKGGSK